MCVALVRPEQTAFLSAAGRKEGVAVCYPVKDSFCGAQGAGVTDNWFQDGRYRAAGQGQARGVVKGAHWRGWSGRA